MQIYLHKLCKSEMSNLAPLFEQNAVQGAKLRGHGLNSSDGALHA